MILLLRPFLFVFAAFAVIPGLAQAQESEQELRRVQVLALVPAFQALVLAPLRELALE